MIYLFSQLSKHLGGNSLQLFMTGLRAVFKQFKTFIFFLLEWHKKALGQNPMYLQRDSVITLQRQNVMVLLGWEVSSMSPAPRLTRQMNKNMETKKEIKSFLLALPILTWIILRILRYFGGDVFPTHCPQRLFCQHSQDQFGIHSYWDVSGRHKILQYYIEEVIVFPDYCVTQQSEECNFSRKICQTLEDMSALA